MEVPEIQLGALPVRIAQVEVKSYVENYKKNVANIFAIIQIVIGLLSIILGSTYIGILQDKCFNINCWIGYGVWSGIVYAVSGILGCCSRLFHPNKYLIIAFMSFSIISASMTVFPVCFAVTDVSLMTWITRYMKVSNNIKIIPSLLLFLELMEVVVAIVNASLCCKAICQCCNEASEEPFYAFYDSKTQAFVFTPRLQDIPEDQRESIVDTSISGSLSTNAGFMSNNIYDDRRPIVE